jgi:tetratricopeptide (TPR) repeat protein
MLCAAQLLAHNPQLSEAKKLYESGKYEEAVKLLNAILESDNNSLEALQLKGDCYQKEEKFVAALQVYDKAQLIYGESAVLNASHGSALLNLKQYRDAEKKIRKALKIDPTLPEAYYFMGNLKYFEFNTMMALKYYNQAIKLNPQYREALYMRAAAYAEMGNYKASLSDYEEVLLLDPSLGVARFNIAVIHLHHDDFEKSAKMLAEIDPASLPNPADYHFNLGEALYFGGQREAACDAYKTAMDLGDEESKKIYMQYCVNKAAREEMLRTRTIRMAF